MKIKCKNTEIKTYSKHYQNRQYLKNTKIALNNITCKGFVELCIFIEFTIFVNIAFYLPVLLNVIKPDLHTDAVMQIFHSTMRFSPAYSHVQFIFWKIGYSFQQTDVERSPETSPPSGTHVHWLIHHVFLPILTWTSMAPDSQTSIHLLLVGHSSHQPLAAPGAFALCHGCCNRRPLQSSQILAFEEGKHLKPLHGLVTLHLQALGQCLVPLILRLQTPLQQVQPQRLLRHPLHPVSDTEREHLWTNAFKSSIVAKQVQSWSNENK